MAVLEPCLAILDETDSGLDIDALKTVADGVNLLRRPDNALLVITHYRSEEHTSELQSLMRISYAVFCLKKKNNNNSEPQTHTSNNKTHTNMHDSTQVIY